MEQKSAVIQNIVVQSNFIYIAHLKTTELTKVLYININVKKQHKYI